MANPIGLFAFPNLTGNGGDSTGGDNVWTGTNSFNFIRLNATDTFTNALATSGILFGTTESANGIVFLTSATGSGSGVRTRATASGWLVDVRSNSASWTNAAAVALDTNVTFAGNVTLAANKTVTASALTLTRSAGGIFNNTLGYLNFLQSADDNILIDNPNNQSIYFRVGSGYATALRLRSVADVAQVALYGGTPVPQASAITAPTGGATVDTECRAAVASILTAIKASTGIGVIAG